MGPLTLLPLLGIALGTSRLARLPLGTAFFFAVAVVILTLYAGALAGALWWTTLAVHLGGVVLLGREALQLAKDRRPVAIPVPIGVLFLLCLWFWLIHGADEYYLYDEYAHWGVFLKDMLVLDGFWTADTNAFHPRYPPGAPLWQYLFNAFLMPSEGKAYFAHFVLLLAPLLALWNGVRWSQPLWIVAILALALAAIANLGLGVSTLYVDQIVGVWFLGVLLTALADDNLVLRRVVLYAAPLAVIALLKDVGVAFAACGAAIVAALVCLRLLASAERSTALRKSAVAAASLLVPSLLCVQVWSWNRDAGGVAHDIASVDAMVSGLIDEAASPSSERDAEISRRLTEVFFDQQLSNSEVSWNYNEFSYDIRELFTDSYRFTTFSLLLGFTLWWAVIAYVVLTPEARRKWLVVAGGVLATALAYIATLHLALQFVFGDRGLELPSYVRYVQVIALPMFLLSFCPLLPAFRADGQQRDWLLHEWAVPRRTTIYVAAMLAVYALETPYLRPILEPNPNVPLRARLEPIVDDIRATIGASRLWIYYTEDTRHGLIGRLVRFLFSPTPAVIETSERFLQNAEAAEVAAAWQRFDYVWIASPLTPEAAAGLSRFTEVATAPFYLVRRDAGGNLRLEPVAMEGYASGTRPTK